MCRHDERKQPGLTSRTVTKACLHFGQWLGHRDISCLSRCNCRNPTCSCHGKIARATCFGNHVARMVSRNRAAKMISENMSFAFCWLLAKETWVRAEAWEIHEKSEWSSAWSLATLMWHHDFNFLSLTSNFYIWNCCLLSSVGRACAS